MELKIEFDASVRKNTITIGCIIYKINTNNTTNTTNTIKIDEYLKDIQIQLDSTRSELFALLHSLQYINNNYSDINKLIIYGDSHSIIKMMSENSEITPTKQDIQQLITAAYKYIYNITNTYNIYYQQRHLNNAHNLVNTPKK